VSTKIYCSNLSWASPEVQQLNSEPARRGSASNRHIKRILLGNVCVLALGLAMAMGSSPAAAKYTHKHKLARKRPEHASKLPFGDIPKGPLEIFVSINQQRLHFYSDGVHVADAPVATGVPGHLTPLGVFSVIERDLHHHSNIYSNAPMPFMERITWSGVALHEGPGVGHQASHGCIRMPGDFAARLWRLPTMGMRVIVARPELRPTAFADPHLFVHKDKPTIPAAALPVEMETAQSVEPGTKTDIVDPPAVAPTHTPPAKGANAEPVQGGADGSPASTMEQSKIGTAQPATTTAAVVAPPAAAVQKPDSTAPAEPAKPALTQAEPSKAANPSLAAIVTGAAADARVPSKAAEPSLAAPAPAEPAKAAAAAGPTATAPQQPTTPAEPTPAQPASAAATQGPTATTPQAAPAEPVKGSATEASAPSKAAEPSPAIPAEAANVTPGPADMTAPISLDDVPLPPIKPAQIARGGSGPIAIFVSRKEGKIYVRQNFTPLFDAPVRIEDPKQPLGTHVFTAMDYLPDHSTFRWTVVTLPSAPPKAVEHWKYVKVGKGRRKRVRVEEQIAEPLPQETPQEALARIEIPQDVIDQISQLIVPGSSLIVSDQGLGPETGRGTDFIVVTR